MISTGRRRPLVQVLVRPCSLRQLCATSLTRADYYKTKYADAMGHMVTLKEKEAFAEELKTILQERLLRTDALNFDQEERLVAMFLLRFSDLNIAQCEIMLKDMQESRMIHNRPSQARQLQAKVLSRAYWPEPDSATFKLPPVMDALTEELSLIHI